MKRLLSLVLMCCILLPLCASAETIAQQVNAPDRYQATYYSNTGKTEILINAVVHIPNTDHVNTYEVAGRDATTHDAMLLALACAPDTDWTNDWFSTQMDLETANGYTSADYSYSWWPLSDDSVNYSPYQYGHPCAEVIAMNYAKETVFGLRRETAQTIYTYNHGTINEPSFYASSAYMDEGDSAPRPEGDKLPNQPITYGEAMDIAETFIQSISPDFQCVLYGSASGERTSRRAYAFRFMRVVDSVPVTYAHWGLPGDDLDDQQYTSPPKMEEITCVIDQGRIVSAYWCNPWEVGGILQENVQLIPFDQIMTIFGTIAPLTIQNMENEYKSLGGSGNRWEITEIRFGYMPVLRKDNSGLWELRPVWDFIGIRSFAKEYYDWPGNCALTIDAIDGTVIDRGYGY